jgi:hypothetical protein
LNLGFWGLKFGVDYPKNLTSSPLKTMVQTFKSPISNPPIKPYIKPPIKPYSTPKNLV